jgi:hypothetical protein
MIFSLNVTEGGLFVALRAGLRGSLESNAEHRQPCGKVDIPELPKQSRPVRSFRCARVWASDSDHRRSADRGFTGHNRRNGLVVDSERLD